MNYQVGDILSILASGLAELAGEEPGQIVVCEAENLLAKMILPKRITGNVVIKYVRKAIQVRAWYRLRRIDKLILLLTRRLPLIKSPVLRSILYKIFLQIELCTVRGKALFYGIIIAMKNMLDNILNNASRLLTIGLFYLNNPTIYRIYG